MISHCLLFLPISRHRSDPPRVTFIHLDDRSATSLTLSWTLSRRPPAHINHRYELMYRRKVSRRLTPLFGFGLLPPQLRSGPSGEDHRLTSAALVLQDDESERDVTTYIVLLLEKNSVQITDLTPDTSYVVRVQVVGAEVSPGSHSVEHVFHTSPLGTSRKLIDLFFFLFFQVINTLCSVDSSRLHR